MRDKRILLYFVFACIFLISCDKKNIYTGEDPIDTQPNEFSFSTKRQVKVNVSYDVPTGYRVYFEAYYTNPLSLNEEKSYVKNTTLMPFLTGYTDENGKFSLSLDIPSYVENIYLYSEYAGVPVLLTGKVSGSSVTISEAAQTPNKALLRGTSGSNYKNWSEFTYSLKRPELKKANMTIDDKLLETINFTLPTEDNIVSQYFYEKITLKEDAEVNLYFVCNGSSARQNALAYYVIPAGQSYSRNQANNHLTLAFSNLKNIKAGEGVKLVNPEDTNNSVFKAGTTIAFALLVDAYDNGNLKSPSHIAYSEKNFNEYTVIYDKGQQGQTIRKEVPHMGAFQTKDGHVILSFEDQPYHDKFTKSIDFRDEVFILETTPPSAIPDDLKPGVDPDEQEPEYNGTITSSGILCFEDNWPKKGDYDLNDVMISYVRTLNYTLPEFMVVSIDETYAFLNNGAAFNNAFGYELGANLKTSNLKSVKITSDYLCDGQGQDEELEKATIMLFNNAQKLQPGTAFQVHTVFKTPVAYSDFHFDPYNPFIVVTNFSSEGYLNTNRTEVHLPKYKPTSKVNEDLFGTEDDKSDLSKGEYYIRSGKYPFALDITLGEFNSSALPVFDIPTESQAINITYPRFNSWVESGGETDADWYKK